MARQASYMILVGIHGSVVALERSTGMELWRTKLKSSDFVNVVLDGDDIFATTKGEIFCLDPATGSIRWRNPLKGLGWGLASMATGSLSWSAQATLLAEKQRREAAAAAGAAAAS